MPDNTIHNVIIVGSGPAGYTAAVYLGRARLTPLLFSGAEIGGQLMYTTVVENYPGFHEGIQGPKLMTEMRDQATHFDTTIDDRLVDRVEKRGELFIVHVGAEEFQTRAVLIATGARARMLDLAGEKELLGRGLSTCAVCDAAFFKDRTVFIIGGGDAAMEDAMALAKFTKDVTIIHRRDEFRASKIMQERVLANPNIKVVWNTGITKIENVDGQLSGIVTQDLNTKAEQTLKAEGLFYAIGHVPSTQFLKDTVQMNEEGFITTRFGLDKASVELASQHYADNGRVAFPTMTSVEGIFAAGDCVDFMYKQAVTAAGYGTMAALDVEHWLDERGQSPMA